MTVKEIIALQEHTGNLYLLRQGLFYRGYGSSAAFLNEVLGYKLMAKEIKSCGQRLLYAGFPAGVLDKVSEVVIQRGGTIIGEESKR